MAANDKTPAENQADLLNFRLELMHENLIGIQAILQSFLGIKELLEAIADSSLVSLNEKQLDYLKLVTENRHIKDSVDDLIQSIKSEGKQ
ncbi:hypothetical protein [Corynebacterium gallinarum]|uniref:Uncharacterized protein n=1 Tax=Corynebacterium gallinarum TaxID=2762214 RepID=A0A8I0HQX6_9CORY|nr:hypothetical protein [Corynebacterium gallinarum]MBD8030802.1 hypothetical protein [Corynebacterium gallinarum]